MSPTKIINICSVLVGSIVCLVRG